MNEILFSGFEIISNDVISCFSEKINAYVYDNLSYVDENNQRLVKISDIKSDIEKGGFKATLLSQVIDIIEALF